MRIPRFGVLEILPGEGDVGDEECGIWAFQDVWPTAMRLQGFGQYHETYEKAGDVADQVVDVDQAPHGSHRVGAG